MKNVVLGFALISSGIAYAQPAGTLDGSFGTNGSFIYTPGVGLEQAHAVSIISDGSILVAGYSSSVDTGKDFLVIKVDGNGVLDNTFGINGAVSIDVQLGSDDIAYAMDVQNDGKIVLAGSSDDGTDKNGALVRLNADGSLDETFSGDGKVVTDFESNQQDEIKVAEIHNLTGNIIVGGSTLISSALAKPVVARYTSAGELDTSFNTTGIKLLWVTSLDDQYVFSVEDLAVQSNGKISAIGWRDFPGLSWSSDHWACKINSDGSMDTSFSTDGVNTYNSNFNGHDRSYAMLLRPDNSMYVAGGSHISTINYDFRLYQITATGGVGTLMATADFSAMNDDIAYDLLETPAGLLIALGRSSASSSSTFALARYSASGAVDSSFGTGGKVTTSFDGNADNGCFAGALQSDEKIVAVGFTGGDLVIARYLGVAQAQLNEFTLNTPANNAINQNYTTLGFNWSDALGATGYTLEYDTDAAFSNPTAVNVVNSAASVTNLQPLTLYYWRVRATDGNTIGDWSVVWQFTTKAPVGVEEMNPSFISCYPNPSNDVVTVNVSTAQLGKTFTIVNMQGQVIKSYPVYTSQFVVNVSEWSNGLYLFTLDGETQAITVQHQQIFSHSRFKIDRSLE